MRGSCATVGVLLGLMRRLRETPFGITCPVFTSPASVRRLVKEVGPYRRNDQDKAQGQGQGEGWRVDRQQRKVTMGLTVHRHGLFALGHVGFLDEEHQCCPYQIDYGYDGEHHTIAPLHVVGESSGYGAKKGA